MNINSTAKIPLSDSNKLSTFTQYGFQPTVWTTNSDTSLPVLLPHGYRVFDITINSTNRVSPILSKIKQTYLNYNWDMERVWTITNGYTLPRLVYRVPADLGEGLTHSMTYFYVVPDLEGTMNYKGQTWKSKGAFFRFPDPPLKGTAGQQVTYTIPESDLKQTIDHKEDGIVDLIWFASGVRDALGAGGFASYQKEKTRTVTVSTSMSATVNFYFTQPHMIPSVAYKVSISTPEGILDTTAISGREYSVIRFSVGANALMSLILVDRDDDLATQIRVSTPDGIKALRLYV